MHNQPRSKRGCLPGLFSWVRRHPLLTIVIIVVLAIFGAITNLAQGSSPSATTPTPDTAATSIQQTNVAGDLTRVAENEAVPTNQPTVATTTVEQPTPSPTVVANSQPTPTPQPTRQPTPQPTQPACQGVNGNPWCYNFTPGNLIYSPNSAFCNYFLCVSTFWVDTNGYVAECGNGKYTHSDGVSGACSRDGGVSRILYSR